MRTLALVIVLFGCGTSGSSGKSGRTPNALEEFGAYKGSERDCPYQDYAVLPDVSAVTHMCPADGRLYEPGAAVPQLDGCNRWGCEIYQDEATLVRTLMACVGMRYECNYGAWTFSHCFKFIDAQGQRCACNNREIECQEK